ncbi:MAG TPA: sulfatase [Thermoanaerobaculia bacterium]|nr:sulfatase [Thermoanaerobaculia bacterium]
MNSESKWRRLSRICVLALVVFCGHTAPVPPGSPFAGLSGRILTGDAVLVVPGPSWYESGGQWQILGEASLVCTIQRVPAAPLAFLFSFAGAPVPVTVLWDGADVTARLRPASDRSFELVLDPKLLGPGTHELTLVAKDAADRPAFASIGYRVGDQTKSFRVQERLRYAYASSLLSRGVTGIDNFDTLGGFLFEGPQSRTLPAGRGSRFSATLENGSFAEAEFVVSDRSVRLRPFERRSVSFDLPSGAFGLTVRGDADGMFLWGAPLVEGKKQDERPPIVLITLDTVRRDALGPYGGDPARTPGLTAFAGHASVYERAYTTSPWTLPAHASIFTGLYPSRHGAGVSAKHLGAHHRTLAELVRDAGYDTAGFAGGLLCGFPSGLAQGFLTYRDPEGFESPDAVLTEKAAARIAGAKRTPLFLFANYFGAHFPFGTAPNAASTLPFQLAISGDSHTWERVVGGEFTPAAGDLDALRASYLAGVSGTDAEVSNLFDALRTAGLYDRALIVVVADHGELLGEGGFFMHSSRLDDELVAVPLMIKWPHQRSGTRERELVSIVDLFPTILAVAGVDAPPSDGIDLAPAGARALAARRTVVAEEHERAFHPLYANMRVDRDLFRLQARERMMLVTNRTTICHLPDGDAWRVVDCTAPEASDMPSVPQLVRDSFHVEPRGHREMNEEQIRNLRSLGYLR